jgi:hypothetical protein
MEDDLKKIKWKTTSKKKMKMEDDFNFFSITRMRTSKK